MLKEYLLTTVAGLAAVLIQISAAYAERGVALTGQVKSDKEGFMEGVIVTAKKDGSTIAYSVATSKNGWYEFPSDKVTPGHYSIKIRATGYDLDGPNAVDVDPDRLTTTASFKLIPTKNLVAQLTNAEWLASAPGTDAQKRFLLSCNSCHTYQRILSSQHDAEEFMQVFDRMAGYYPGSTPLQPQRLTGTARRNLGGGGVGNAMGPATDARADVMKAAANWLASVNLSKGERNYQFQTLPRPTGKATRMVVTEYDLPRKTIMPHDVMVDSDGMVWYSDFGALFMGKMDPKTGQVTEYPIPKIKEGSPVGTLDLEQDAEGNMWVAMMYQGGVAKLDKKTGKVETWSVPKEWQTDATQQSFASPNFWHVDGKVWVKNSDRAQIMRMDPKTNQWENFGSFTDPTNNRPIGSYGINADRNNNLYMLDFNSNNIGVLDGNTKKFEVYKTLTPNSRPRRGRVDEQNRLWFAEYDGNGVGMFDPATKAIKEWVLPTPWSNPYDAVVDKNGDAWTASMMTDRVTRINTKTGEQTEYLLPNPTNIRRVWVDNSTTPVTFWVGSNHGGSIVKLQPIE